MARNSRALGRLFAVAIVVNGLVCGAQADDSFDKWQNTLAPLYLWGVSLSGDAQFGPASLPIDVEFKDAVQDLEGIFTIHYEGARKNWGVIADYSFLNLTPKAETPTGAELDVDLKNTIIELDALYRFGPNNPWQLLAGVRSYTVDRGQGDTAADLPERDDQRFYYRRPVHQRFRAQVVVPRAA